MFDMMDFVWSIFHYLPALFLFFFGQQSINDQWSTLDIVVMGLV